jgi:hypothetical protein
MMDYRITCSICNSYNQAVFDTTATLERQAEAFQEMGWDTSKKICPDCRIREHPYVNQLRSDLDTANKKWAEADKNLCDERVTVYELRADLDKARDEIKHLRNSIQDERGYANLYTENIQLKCCGNCRWNTNALVHDKCDLNNWVAFSGKDRGRGMCDNWQNRPRKG